MTLTTLLISFGIIGILLTLVTKYLLGVKINWIVTFMQFFCGVWYFFSGLVKAIDPMGTAFKMKEYFGEFSRHFDGSFLSFLSPLWPFLSEHVIWVSIFVILLEILLGVALIIGYRRLGTAWVFLLLLLFFIKLTGFTYLTGYVPSEAHFFDFSQWTAYKESNMKVTDCGCFGDFLKLEPKVSFFKDIFLLLPALVFVFFWESKHELYTSNWRRNVMLITGILALGLCYYNTFMNEPIVDFRPFTEGTNIREVKKAEEEAAAEVKVTGYKLVSKSDGKVVEMPMEQFMNEFKNYPAEHWEYEQIKTEPRIKHTKISDFRVETDDGREISGEILGEKGYSLMFVSYMLDGLEQTREVSVSDTTELVDSVLLAKNDPNAIQMRITTATKNEVFYTWNSDFVKIVQDKINPLMDGIAAEGVKTLGIAGGAFTLKLDAFRKDNNVKFPIYMQDDLVVKTIMRSNPGLILWKDGVIVAKWHYKDFPSLEELKKMVKS